ncbi:MAG: transposase [Saprospiraceae bacterium]
MKNKKGRKVLRCETPKLTTYEEYQWILASIFARMDGAGKWWQKFFAELFVLIFSIQGRVNFENLARYSKFNECRFRRNFQKFFDWLEFNYVLFTLWGHTPGGELLAAVDCSFLPKAGKNTFGLDRFWSGVANATKRGLEISLLSLIDVASATAWTLDVTQTPPGLSRKESKEGKYTRLDFYIEQILDCLPKLDKVRYFVADGFYAKTKMFNALHGAGKHLITKLRPDADLRYPFTGVREKGRRGRTPIYDGKVKYDDLSRWTEAGADEKYPYLQLYTQVLYSPKFERWLRVVLVLNTKTNQYILLACSDVELPAKLIVKYYQLRFQVEFLFRDAKQFAGLTHCQARDEAKLDFHFNMSLAAINIMQVHRKLDPSIKSIDFILKVNLQPI